MRISGIRFNTCINRFANIKTDNVCKSPFVSSLSFRSNEDVFERNPLNKFKDFTIEEYEKLSADEIAGINKEIDIKSGRRYDKDVNMHNALCEGMQSYLDKKYGENNYIVINLGRSLSSVGKCLGYKIGENNVKNVPMSMAGRFCLSSDTSEDVKSFADYLKSIGLSKEDVEKSGKELVLMDYSYTGRSLIGAKKILQRDDVLGNKKEIHTENVIDMVKGMDLEVLKKYGFNSEQHFRIDAEILFWNSDFKKYSLVEKCTDLQKTSDAVLKLNEEPEYKKQFLFKLLDSNMKN